MFLGKRDNMGFQIAPALIIFLVILGSGALVCCGFAIFRFYGGDVETDAAWTRRSPEQDLYMRQCRDANWAALCKNCRLPNVYGPSSRLLPYPPTARPWHFKPRPPTPESQGQRSSKMDSTKSAPITKVKAMARVEPATSRYESL